MTIIVKEEFDVPIKNVWNAITNVNEMKEWYYDIPEFITEVGFKFQFESGPEPDRQYYHLCEIKDVEPGKKISYSWEYDGYPGTSIVLFKLENINGKTALMLEHKGVTSFPSDVPDLAFDNFIEGWNHIIHVSLKEYLEQKK